MIEEAQYLTPKMNSLSVGTGFPLNTINWLPAYYVPTLFVSYRKVYTTLLPLWHQNETT
jgi:hypothetical protein